MVEEFAPAADKELPAVQLRHTADEVALSVLDQVPAGHSSQAEAAICAHDPGGHALQGASPKDEVPAAQLTQTSAPSPVEYVPP